MEENNSTMSITKRCIIAVLCERTSLFLLVTVYTLLGAIIFKTIEGGENHDVPVDFKKSREDCLKELWIITERLNVLYERNWTKLVTEQLKRFERSILESGRNEDSFNVSRTPWTFGSALLYSITLLTTVGYSKLSPNTVLGKISAMLYAIIGVPLMLILLSALGGCLARGARSGYSKICCYGKVQGVKRSASSVGYRKAPTSPTGKFHGNRSHEDTASIQIAFPSSTPNHAIELNHNHQTQKSPPSHIDHQTVPKRTPLATVRSSHTRGRVKQTVNETTLYATASCPAHDAPRRCVATHSALAGMTSSDLEDAEDTDNELVICPAHDTPSRIPLIWRPPEPPINHHPLLRPPPPEAAAPPPPATPTVPALLVFCVFAAYVGVGASLLCATDARRGFLDAVYVCFLAVATVGVGEGMPDDGRRDVELVACGAYVFVGLAVVAMCLSLAHEEVAARCRQAGIAIRR